MKVGVNSLFLIPSEVGGTETYLRQTLRAMAEFCPDVDLVIFTNRENDPVLRADLSPFRQVAFEPLDFNAVSRPTRILLEQVRLPGRVRKAGVDVLWSAGYTAPFSCPCPQVVTIHDMQYKTHPEDMSLPERLATDFLVRMAARRCRRVIAVSRFSRDEIIRHTSAAPDKVDAIHEAANPAFAEPLDAPALAARLKDLVPPGKPYLLSVSATYPHKRMDLLVDAFGEIMASAPHTLVMVGSARRGEPAVQAALARLPDRNRVIRLERLSMQQLVPLYQGADAFVFPSFYEGFGLPVLEAMMAGVPVVAGPHASIPELGGDAILYYDRTQPATLARKIREALAWPPDKRRAVTDAARARARTFTWRTTAEQTLATLRAALA